jgi:hypothetical protein
MASWMVSTGWPVMQNITIDSGQKREEGGGGGGELRSSSVYNIGQKFSEIILCFYMENYIFSKIAWSKKNDRDILWCLIVLFA